MKTAFLITLILISTAVLVSPAFASAATNAGVKPGSFWYRFDIAFEKINLFFTFNPEGKARKALQYADERLAEAEAVAESNNNTDAVKTAISNYESNIAFAAEKSKDVSEKEKAEALLTTISDSTSKHQEILADVLAKVPDEAKEAITKAIEASRKGQEEAMKQIAELKGEVEQLKKEVEELKKKDEEKQAAEIERLKKEVEELKKKPAPATQPPAQTPAQQAPTQQTPTPTPSPIPTPPPIIQQQPTPSYSYSVETSIVDYKDAAAIQATVIGNKGALNVILSGPNKSTVDTEYISDNDMLDGSETKWLHLQRYAKSNPVSGLYTLIAKEFGGKEVFRKEFNIQGPKPTIVSHSLKWKNGPYSVSTTYEVDTLGFYITVRNDGDLTLYLRDADVLLNNTHLYVLGTSLGKYKMAAGETATISVGSSSVTAGSSFYDAGTYPMVIDLRGQVDGELKTLTTYTTSILVP